MNRLLTRRLFLRTTSAALAINALPVFVPSSVLGQQGVVSPGNRINVGCIGVGERGCEVMKGFLKQADTRVVALCDVHNGNRKIAADLVAKQYGAADCALLTDFRELVARKDIDAVVVASPDHWHVLHGLAAVRAGKDVYVEKPLGLSLTQLQGLRTEVQKRDRRFQFGTQQRSDKNFYRAAMLARNGQLGKLKEIYAWAPGSNPGGSTEPSEAPAGLDFDFWLGPAPARPYQANLCDRALGKKTWWVIYDFALGWVAGWGIHPVDIALWGAGELFDGEVEVEGQGTIPTQGASNTAATWLVNYRFSSGVTMRFIGTRKGAPVSDGADLLKEWQSSYKGGGHGTVFVGTDGWVEVHRGGLNASSEELRTMPLETLPHQLVKSSDHARNFLDAFKSREQTICPIDTAVKGDILCHLADQAMRAQKKLVWDTQKEKITNDDSVHGKFAVRAMRAPWLLMS